MPHQWRDHTERLKAKHRSELDDAIIDARKEAAVTALEVLKGKVRRIEPIGFDRCSHLSLVMALIIELQKEIHHGDR